MPTPRDEFIKLPIMNPDDHRDSKWGYIHAMSIVAIVPAFIRSNSQVAILHMANGNTIYVSEYPEKLVKTFVGE